MNNKALFGEKSAYLVQLREGGRTLYLPWVDGGSSDDFYLIKKDDPKTLFFAQDKKHAQEYAENLGFTVAQEEVGLIIDFKRINSAISSVSAKSEIPTSIASMLLNAWNFFDDIAYSTKIEIIPNILFPKHEIDQIYQKLYFGNNLPAVTPNGCVYHPIFTRREQKQIRRMFHTAMRNLITTLPRDVDVTC